MSTSNTSTSTNMSSSTISGTNMSATKSASSHRSTVSHVAGPSTAGAHAMAGAAGSSTSTSNNNSHGPSNSNSNSNGTGNPSPESARQVAEAKRALTASMSNIGTSLDTQLRSRAANLHANSAVLSKQQKDLGRATSGLRRDTDALAKVLGEGTRKIKEVGNVQNWAELLERDFLLLDETLRLAAARNRPEPRPRRAGLDADGDFSGSSGSGSDWETDSDDAVSVASAPIGPNGPPATRARPRESRVPHHDHRHVNDDEDDTMPRFDVDQDGDTKMGGEDGGAPKTAGGGGLFGLGFGFGWGSGKGKAKENPPINPPPPPTQSITPPTTQDHPNAPDPTPTRAPKPGTTTPETGSRTDADPLDPAHPWDLASASSTSDNQHVGNTSASASLSSVDPASSANTTASTTSS